jgi:CrcB protein
MQKPMGSNSNREPQEEAPVSVVERVERPCMLRRWLLPSFLLQPAFVISAGAVLGVSARFTVKSIVDVYLANPFPIGTLLVNLAGCYLIGIMQTLFLELISVRREVQLCVSVGFLGGFTTFSSISVETISLLQMGNLPYALTYQVVSLIGGLLAVLAGVATAYMAHHRRGT